MGDAILERATLIGVALATLALAGCQQNTLTDAQQAQNKAQAAVEKMLDAWSRGETPEQFAAADPTLQSADPDWKTGHRLLSFLTSDTKCVNENAGLVHCRVALSLQSRAGRKLDKQVTYEVKLSDPIQIDRLAVK